jgi:hypothetical protein
VNMPDAFGDVDGPLRSRWAASIILIGAALRGGERRGQGLDDSEQLWITLLTVNATD